MKINYPKFRKDLTNQQFSHLSVIAFNDKTKKWKCQCDCGNITYVKRFNGNTRSCGCLKKMTFEERKKALEKGEKNIE